jgi:3',5'-cyclic AMP phosphodiesterase CpdA
VVPDRILLTWDGDPARTQAVTWRTDTSVQRAYAEYTLADDGPHFGHTATRVEARTEHHRGDLDDAHYHTVTLADLAPATRYVYRVGDGTNWSAWIHFRTAASEPEPFSFVYFGDAQNNIKSLWPRVFRNAVFDAPQARFMLHAGDLVNRGNRDAEWGEWHQAGGWVNAMIPSIAVPGNHEYDIVRTAPLPATVEEQKALPRSLASRWQARFEFPDNGPREFTGSLAETAYFIDFQGLRIVALNSMEDIELQARWLECVLAEEGPQWTIVTHHHPVISVAEGRDNPELRDAWQSVYDRHRVDLVLQGHDHTYGRTGLQRYGNVPTGTTARSEAAGTVYVVSVSGPKMYEAVRANFVRLAEDTQLYQIISVDGDKLHYEARTAAGRLYDAFTLVKQPGKPNRLIERVPSSEERLRTAPDEPIRAP